MLLYAVSRFVIEFYRGDERGTVGIFSTSQFISIILAPLRHRHAGLPRARDSAAPSAKTRAQDRAAMTPPSPSPTTATASGSIVFLASVLAATSRARRFSG